MENTNQILSYDLSEIMIRLSSLFSEVTMVKKKSKMQPQSTKMQQQNSCSSNKASYKGGNPLLCLYYVSKLYIKIFFKFKMKKIKKMMFLNKAAVPYGWMSVSLHLHQSSLSCVTHTDHSW